MALSTRIAVIDKGQIIQIGTPAEIYEFPQSRFVAEFVGTTNLFEGTVVEQAPGAVLVRSPEAGGDLMVDDAGRYRPGETVWVAVRPEKIKLSKQPSADTRRNQLKGVVSELGYLGNHSTYRIRTASDKLVTVFAQNDRRTADWSIDWSDQVFLGWDADAAIVLRS